MSRSGARGAAPIRGATFLPTEIETPNYSPEKLTGPSVSVSAARDVQGALQLALVNLDTRRKAAVTVRVSGADAQGSRLNGAVGRVLTAAAMDAHDTPDEPERVTPVKLGTRRSGGALVLTLPPMSVSLVKLQ